MIGSYKFINGLSATTRKYLVTTEMACKSCFKNSFFFLDNNNTIL